MVSDVDEAGSESVFQAITDGDGDAVAIRCLATRHARSLAYCRAEVVITTIAIWLRDLMSSNTWPDQPRLDT